MARLLVIFSIALLYSTAAFAEASFQFAMAGVRAPEDPNVNGMRFVLLYGRNDSVAGLDLGFAALSDVGAQLSLRALGPIESADVHGRRPLGEVHESDVDALLGGLDDVDEGTVQA